MTDEADVVIYLLIGLACTILMTIIHAVYEYKRSANRLEDGYAAFAAVCIPFWPLILLVGLFICVQRFVYYLCKKVGIDGR